MAEGAWEPLLRRVQAMHAIWNLVTSDLSTEQMNHHERSGILPITFTLFHYVNGEDRNVAERFYSSPPIWNDAWKRRTGIDTDAIKRGTPIAVAEQVRITDASAWSAYQNEVFARTETGLGDQAAGRWGEVAFQTVPDHFKGGFIDYLVGNGPVLLGDLMDALLYQHGMRHVGEIEHARSLVGLQGAGSVSPIQFGGR